jgi:hypothetical protein
VASSIQDAFRAAQEKRRVRQDVGAFSGLVAVPTNLGTVAQSGQSNTLTLPANAKLAMSFSAVLPAAAYVLNVNAGALLYSAPARAQGVPFVIDNVEKAKVIRIVRGTDPTSGTLTIAIIDGSGRRLPIATVTFS